jgi:hypothetical protein
MPTIKTHEILAEGITAHLVEVLAKAFGVEKGTVRAWRHPKESDENPTGTGKGNPLDQAARLIRIVHQYNPGNARQAAHYFSNLVNELDRAGCEVAAYAEPEGDILDHVRSCIKEGADVHTVLVGAQFDEHTLRRARREIAEEQAALQRLDGVLCSVLEKQERSA